jgi:hypothetical protein
VVRSLISAARSGLSLDGRYLHAVGFHRETSSEFPHGAGGSPNLYLSLHFWSIEDPCERGLKRGLIIVEISMALRA